MTARGEARRFLDDAIAFRGERCLFWPYAKTARGYAKITIWHQQKQVSRIVCERVHGPPPTEAHQAAHSCGLGHLGCIAPAHLRWATATENAQERIRHGTQPHGDSHWTRRRIAAPAHP